MENDQISSIPSQKSFYETIKNSINWKYAILITMSAFLIYPRPFLYILNPFIKRVSNSYKQKKPRLKKIFLTTQKNITPEKLIYSFAFNGNSHDIIVVNLLHDLPIIKQKTVLLNSSTLDTQQEDNKSGIQLKADNAVLRIKLLMFEARQNRNSDYAILIKGSSELLRVIQLKLYGFDSEETYKIPLFKSRNDVHVLDAGKSHSSFEHKVIKIQI